DVPFAGDGAGGTAAVPPRAPGDLLFLEDLLEFLSVRIAIDADQGERFAFQPFDERPLVRVHGPARPSPMPPEIEHDHLAAIIAQLEAFAIDVFALNLRGDLANDEIVHLEQGRFGYLTQSAAGAFHVTVLGDKAFEQFLHFAEQLVRIACFEMLEDIYVYAFFHRFRILWLSQALGPTSRAPKDLH